MLIPPSLAYRSLYFYSLPMHIEWPFTLSLGFLLITLILQPTSIQAIELCCPRSALPIGLPKINLSCFSEWFAFA